VAAFPAEPLGRWRFNTALTTLIVTRGCVIHGGREQPRTSDEQAWAFPGPRLGHVAGSIIKGTTMSAVERYRIAQLFHEQARRGAGRLAAARLIARLHGLQAEQVLHIAADFEPEPLWRL
jgi:hypothetical protein